MQKKLKTWSAAGMVVVVGALAADAGTFRPQAETASSLLLPVQSEGGEGGEGGGETPTTYAINSTDANAFNYDAKPQVSAYADLVHAAYLAAKTDADAMTAAISSLLAEPSEKTLAAARQAWIKARPAYLKTEAFRFYDGPIEAIEGEINAWPMNEAFIDYVEGKPDAGLINSKDGLNATFIAGANQKADEADVTTGWHAIEFLLWGQDVSVDGPGQRPFTDYVAGQGNNDRRRVYLKIVTDKLVGDLQTLEQAWAPSVTDNYRATFEKLEQREALGRIINGMAILAGFEFMSERLAVALDSGDQEDEHSCFSDTTKQDFIYDLVGIKDIWYGANIGALVATLDANLAKRVSDQLLETEVKINKLGDPWDKVLAATKDSAARKDAEAAVSSLQNLADGLKDVGSKLGVLVLIPSG